MWMWYESAQLCYVYLWDVALLSSKEDADLPKKFARSAWFRRGWTLQELIAPRRLLFYGQDWHFIRELAKCPFRAIYQSLSEKEAVFLKALSSITQIPPEYLSHQGTHHTASIAQRMSWAAHRQTERSEDIAYSLLGLFNINMPLLYGEGSKAFRRLQREIIRQSDDQSIFAWKDDWLCVPKSGQIFMSPRLCPTAAILAQSPKSYHASGRLLRWEVAYHRPFHITNTGLEIWARAAPVAIRIAEGRDYLWYILQLGCIDTTEERMYGWRTGVLIALLISEPRDSLSMKAVAETDPLVAKSRSLTCELIHGQGAVEEILAKLQMHCGIMEEEPLEGSFDLSYTPSEWPMRRFYIHVGPG